MSGPICDAGHRSVALQPLIVGFYCQTLSDSYWSSKVWIQSDFW